MDYYRQANSRGHANYGWLDTKHSFSFGSYYDPKHMGISALRVINDDTIAPETGFDMHPHKNMEIISYILEGEVEHTDSMGHTCKISAGEVQHLSAGTGIRHAEINRSQDQNLRLLQIWLLPNQKSLKPSYDQRRINSNGPITPLVTRDGREGSLKMHQDASLSKIELKPGEEFKLQFKNRIGYLHCISGSVQATSDLNQAIDLNQADGLGVIRADQLFLQAKNEKFDALWFDLPDLK